MRIGLIRRLFAAAVVAAALGGGVVVAAASTGVRLPSAATSPTPGRASGQPARAQAGCERFIGHLAQDLGKGEADVRSAIAKAAAQTVDDAVKAGDLTSAQGDRLKARLNERSLCTGALAGLGRRHGARPGAFKGAYLEAAAKALGVSPDELKADLRKGMTLHQVADSKKISESQFRSAVIGNLTPALDRAVQDGKLTKAQEDAILDRLRNRPLPLWDLTQGHRASS